MATPHGPRNPRRSALLSLALVALVLLGVVWLSSGEDSVPGRAPVPSSATGDDLGGSSPPEASSGPGPPFGVKSAGDASTFSGAFEGAVVDGFGRHVPTAIVEARESATDAILASAPVDPGDGAFRLGLPVSPAPRRYRVRALDPATLDASAPIECDEALGPVSDSWTLFVLRETLLVRGRVVDRKGEPSPGRVVRVEVAGLRRVHDWNQLEGEAETTDVRTDGIGRFLVRVRRGGGSGGVAVQGADTAWGATHEFQIPEAGALDLGDLLDPTDDAAHWTLRFVRRDGNPCDDACVKLHYDDRWTAESHPNFDARWAKAIRTDAAGVVRLTVGLRTPPVIVGIGGPRYATRGLSLDCSRAGTRETTVKLEPRPVVVVRLVGRAVPALVDLGIKVSLGSRRSLPVPESRDYECTDALTGEPVAIPPSRFLSAPVLLDEWLPIRRGDHRLAPDLFELRAHPGWRYDFVDLHEGPHGWFVCRREIDVVAGTATQTVDVPVPDGRCVVLDVTDVDKPTENGSGTWFSRFSAWPRIPGDAALGGLPDRETTHFAVDLLSTEGRRNRMEVRMWLPAEADSVVFGYPRGLLWSEDAPQSEVVYGVPSDDVPRIRAPPPSQASTSVTIALRRGGARSRQRGIPVAIAQFRGDAVVEDKIYLTNSNGCVVARVSPGAYSAQVASGAIRSASCRFEARPGTTSLAIDLDWEIVIK